MGAYTTLTNRGQLTIPKEVREALHLEPGTRFYVMVQEDQVLAIPQNKRLADLAGFLGKPPNGATFSIEDMDEAIMDAVAEDDARIMREWHEGET